MGRTAKKSDLVKSDLKKFSIGLTEAKRLKITKEDLKGITEIIPDEKYSVRATTGNRKAEIFKGDLLGAIKRKNELNKNSKEKDKNVTTDITFMEAVSLYINYLFEREDRGDLDINTVFDHVKKINADITDFFGKYKMSEIDSNLIEQFITYMRIRPKKKSPDKRLSEGTISTHLRTLNALLNYLVSKKIIVVNPYNSVTNKPNPKKNKKELIYFRIEEAKYALKCLDKFADIRLKTFMNIIFSLGCRREEACGLRWCDIDFVTKEVDFTYAKTSSVPKKFLSLKIQRDKKLNNENNNKDYNRVRNKGLKTENSYRVNYLSDVAINCLKNYYKFKVACGIDVKPTDPIFTTYREGRNIDKKDINEKYLVDDNKPIDPNKLSENWRNFKRQYGVKDVDLHRIRHTIANVLERNGVPKKDIAKMLGNTERVLEEFYTHVDVDELKKLRNTLDSELFVDIECVDLSIDLAVKILNDYDMDSLTEDDLKKLDLISSSPVNSDNYIEIIKIAKDLILTNDSKLDYFIDNDANSLKIKLQTYKKFNKVTSIKIKKEQDISIKRDILSF